MVTDLVMIVTLCMNLTQIVSDGVVPNRQSAQRYFNEMKVALSTVNEVESEDRNGVLARYEDALVD